MNQQNLTQRDLETNRSRSILRILLLVIFTPPLAIQGLGQATSGPSENTQAQLQRKTQPLIDLDRSTSTPQSGPDLSKWAVFGEVGVAVPHGDLNAFLDPGFSANVGVEYMITSQFSAVGMLGYQRFSNGFFTGNTNLYQVAGNAKVYLVDESTKLRPFVNGGVGDYVTDSGTSHFGGNVGGGVLYEVSPRFGIQGSYNFHIFSAGATFRFSTLQGGVRFRF